jgi:hypothetical protein
LAGFGRQSQKHKARPDPLNDVGGPARSGLPMAWRDLKYGAMGATQRPAIFWAAGLAGAGVLLLALLLALPAGPVSPDRGAPPLDDREDSGAVGSGGFVGYATGTVGGHQTTRLGWSSSAVEALMEAPLDNLVTAASLAELVSTLPAGGPEQVEAAQAMAALLPDDDYALAAGLLLDPRSPVAVMEVIYDDVLTRRDSAKLPLLVGILEAEGHPLRGDAHGELRHVTASDLPADDPAAWRQTVAYFVESGATAGSE